MTARKKQPATPFLALEADVSTHVDAPTVTPSERVALNRNRLPVREAILNCTDCHLSATGWVRTPVPFHGPTPALYTVVGEAPGMIENRRCTPFVGPAGTLLRNLLWRAGLSDRDAFFCNVVNCWPNGTPDAAAISHCSHHLNAQLSLGRSKYVLLAGNVALTTFRPDLRVGNMSGHPFIRGGVAYMPILHPAYVLRNVWEQDRMTVALERFASLINNTTPAIDLTNGWCARQGCGGSVRHYDPECVGWCARCWVSRDKTTTELIAERDRANAQSIDLARRRVRKQQQGRIE